MPLTIDQIRAARAAVPKRLVSLPDLDGEVYVRALSCAEVRQVEKAREAKLGGIDLTKKVVELAACNEDGSPLFVGEDIKLLDALTWGTIDALSKAAMEISGMSGNAVEDEKKG